MKIFRLVGIGFIIAAIYLVVGSVQDYSAQLNQQDWTVITAEVSDVSSRVVSSGSSRRHGGSNSRTVYDIIYEYEVDGKTYTGEHNGASSIKLIGDEIKIKYDPDSPKESTTTLLPKLSSLIIPLIAAGVFGTAGLAISGFLAWILKLMRRGKPEEEEILPPEAYVDDTPKEANVSNAPTVIILQKVVPIAIIALMVFLFIQLPSGKKAVSPEQFETAVKAQGYTVSDTTDKYREEWKIGSLLKECTSFETSDVRIDFCVMDTNDSARQIYSGMNLPVTDGTIAEDNGLNDSFYSVENDKLYTAKLRVGTTVIYAACTPENKDMVLGVLKEIGYIEE